MKTLLAWTIGLVAQIGAGQLLPVSSRPGTARRDRDERGLSQSTENAILLAGAVAVAGIVVAVITVYVRNHLPK